MRLEVILEQIKGIAESNRLTVPHICGGTPRDKYMNRLEHISDIDLTSGDESIHVLADLCAKQIRGGTAYKKMDDGHAQLHFGELKIDFSSNFIYPNVKTLLQNAGLKNPTKMQEELYSRDFTCNALLLDLDLKTLSDPIGLGIPDIKNETLKTCLPANLTLGIDIKRIPRVIYLASKLNFKVDEEIINWVKKNKNRLREIKPTYITKKINAAIDYNKELTIGLITQLELWDYIPITDKLTG